MVKKPKRTNSVLYSEEEGLQHGVTVYLCDPEDFGFEPESGESAEDESKHKTCAKLRCHYSLVCVISTLQPLVRFNALAGVSVDALL